MTDLVKQYMPQLFVSELQNIKHLAGKLAANVLERLAEDCCVDCANEETLRRMRVFVQHYPFIQFLALTDKGGKLTQAVITDPAYAKRYGNLPEPGYDYSNREWFIEPMKTGELHITDLYQSQYTGKLIISVSKPVTDSSDQILGVLCGDIQLEHILEYAPALENKEKNERESEE